MELRKANGGICLVVLVLLAAIQVHAAHAQTASSIDLKRALSPQYPCRSFERPIQFFSETELLVLSGAAGYCYRSVDQLRLNLISIDGRVLATKAWHSTDPGLVIAPGRLLLATPSSLEVDNRTLTAIQSLRRPRQKAPPSLSVHQQGTVSISFPDGEGYLYGVSPLKLLKVGASSQTGPDQPVFKFADGQTVIRSGESLISSGGRNSSRTVMSLKWVIPPCGRYVNCQAYGAGFHFQVSTGKNRRILVISNGSKFPVTDAAGLFPYFRLQIFDLNTGKTLYRREEFLRTAERYASISPDGDRLATTDGKKVIIRVLP